MTSPATITKYGPDPELDTIFGGPGRFLLLSVW
jgi:hypothetical protein